MTAADRSDVLGSQGILSTQNLAARLTFIAWSALVGAGGFIERELSKWVVV